MSSDIPITKIRQDLTSWFPTEYPVSVSDLILRPLEEITYSEVNLRAFDNLNSIIPIPYDKLIEEAHILLLRCLELKREKKELDVKAAELWLSISKEKDSLISKQRSVNSGEFLLPYNLAEKDYVFASRAKKEATEAARVANMAVEARMLGSPLREKRIADYSAVTNLSAPTSNPELAKVAESLATNSLDYEILSSETTKYNSALNLELFEHQLQSADIRREFFKQDAISKNELFDIEKKYHDLRTKLASDSSSGLNYKERIFHILKIFNVDYAAAIKRIEAIHLGISNVIGLQINLPPSNDESSVEDIIVWLRDVIDKLIILFDTEIVTTMTFSLKSLISSSDWDRFKQGELVNFNLDHSSFFRGSCIRIKQISLFSLSKNEHFPLSIKLQLPKLAQVIHLDGKSNTLDQSSIPILCFGDVRARRAGDFTSVCDSRALHNSSPIGTWSTQAINGISSDIEDMQIDVAVSMLNGGN